MKAESRALWIVTVMVGKKADLKDRIFSIVP